MLCLDIAQVVDWALKITICFHLLSLDLLKLLQPDIGVMV